MSQSRPNVLSYCQVTGGEEPYDFRWYASYEGRFEVIGVGWTQEEAVEDLNKQINEEKS